MNLLDLTIDWPRVWTDVEQVIFGWDWETFLEELRKPAGNPFSLQWNPSQWEWSQLLDPANFEWKVGKTPLSDLRVTHIKLDHLCCLGVLLHYHCCVASIDGIPYSTHEIEMVCCFS